MTGSNRWLALLGACAVACAVYDNQTPGALGGAAGETASMAGSGAGSSGKGPGGTGSGSGGNTTAGSAGTLSGGGNAGNAGTTSKGGTPGVAEGGDDSGGDSGLAGANGEAGQTSGGMTLGGNAGMAGNGGGGGSGGNAGHAGSGGSGGAAGGNGGSGGSAGTSGNGGAGGNAPTCSDHPLTARDTWVASASHSKATEPPANLLDNMITRWSTGKPQAGDEWLQIDFGASVSFDHVNLQQGTDTNDYPRTYSVIVSNTSKDVSATPVLTGSSKTGVSTAISLPSIATGQYLLIKQTGTSLSWWSAEEIEVSCSN